MEVYGGTKAEIESSSGLKLEVPASKTIEAEPALGKARSLTNNRVFLLFMQLFLMNYLVS